MNSIFLIIILIPVVEIYLFINYINIILIPDISYSSGFSPNNDGVNDTWSIDQIDQFPNCNVEIYNRWGTLLFKSIGYDEQWTGLFNEKPLPIGTYYFVIELNDPLFPDLHVSCIYM